MEKQAVEGFSPYLSILMKNVGINAAGLLIKVKLRKHHI